MSRYRPVGLRLVAALLVVADLCIGQVVTVPGLSSPTVRADEDSTVPRGPVVSVSNNGATVQVRAIQQVRTADGREAVADRLIVGFQPSVSDPEKDAVHQEVGQAVPPVHPVPLKPVGTNNAQYVDVTGAPSLEAVIQAYQSDARVRYAEPDYLMRPAETPNDPNFTSQYGMRIIQAPAAWNVTHGDATVKIAVLDCGIYESHPDLAGKVLLRKDFSSSPFGTDDKCNHGTHVAGIVSADTNNGVGVAGVGYNSALMNGKVLLEQFDSNGNLTGSSGSSTWAVSGIHWAVDNGAKVINLSLGGVFTPVSGSGATCAQTYQDAVNYATTHNVVIVAAAGNDGALELFQPASCAGVISVASTDANDVKSSFSNYGAWVSVAAPGSAILSTVNPTIAENQGNSYMYFNGTSMASPHVAGLAGLLWTTVWGANANAIVSRILSTADPIAGATGVQWQTGRINAIKAVTGLAPVLTNRSPSSMPAGSGAFNLTITGNNFAAGATVLWNGSSRGTTFVSSTQLVAVIQAADVANAGSASVSVANPDGSTTAAPLSFTITASPPRPTSISPNSGNASGGTTVTISGDYFQAGANVQIGGTAASVQSVTNSLITVVTPAHATGTVSVVVTNPDAQAATMSNAFTYVANPEPTGRGGPPGAVGSPGARPQPRPVGPQGSGINATPAMKPPGR